jgi:hypothetical protein
MVGSVAGPLGAVIGGIIGDKLVGDQPISWGPANINLDFARILERANPILAKSSTRATVDALRNTGTAIAYLAAAVSFYGSRVPGDIQGRQRTAHIVVQHNVGGSNYQTYLDYDAFPVRESDGSWIASGVRGADGNKIGVAGAAYLNNVMPLVDAARSFVAVCRSFAKC